MARDYNFWVYIVTNEHDSVLYVGMTNNLARRIAEHRAGEIPWFTADFRCRKLVYYEHCTDVRDAIAREKQLVSWNCPLCDRTRVGVRSGKAAGRDDQSRPFVSSIHALPLALSKTRTVTGATKPVQPKGGAGLASSHLQAGVI